MNENIVKEQLNNLSENVEEIMSSTRGVKGPEFALLVSLTFESMQLMELVGKITSCAEEEYRGYAEALLGSTVNIMSSMMVKLFEGYTDEQIKEAGDIAKMLIARRADAVAAIKKGMENERD
jgi:hypothetical protein